MPLVYGEVIMNRVTQICTAAVGVAIMMWSVGAQARDRNRSSVDSHRERSEHISPQVNGYGNYANGHYQTSPDAYRSDGRGSGGISFDESSSFLFKGKSK